MSKIITISIIVTIVIIIHIIYVYDGSFVLYTDGNGSWTNYFIPWKYIMIDSSLIIIILAINIIKYRKTSVRSRH